MSTETQTQLSLAHDPYFYGWRDIARLTPQGMVSEKVPLTEWDVLHPLEGDFIVHNDAHNDICQYLKNVFRWRLAGHERTLVLQDHRVDWQFPGIEPHGPDVVVFFDAGPWDRSVGTYTVRNQGARPVLVIEVTSPSTRANDVGVKVQHYARIGIPLYVIVDLQPPNRDNEEDAPEIVFTAYRPSPEGPVRVVDEEPNRVWLPELNLWLAAEGDTVVALEPDGTPVGDYLAVALWAEEAEERANEAEERANEAEERANEAEAARQTEKLKAERAKWRADTQKARADTAEVARIAEGTRADGEKARADTAEVARIAEGTRADGEKARADAAETARVAEKTRADENAQKLVTLEAELKRLRGDTN